MREEPKHQCRVTLATVTLGQLREAEGVSISIGGAVEGSSGFRRTVLEGRNTLSYTAANTESATTSSRSSDVGTT